MATRVLFVCLGNICRSPLGKGILRHLAREAGLEAEVEVDSAGTGTWRLGEEPDPRSVQVAARNGITLDRVRSRLVTLEDFAKNDLILAMDARILADLRMRCPAPLQPRLTLLRAFDPEGPGDVPDPFLLDESAFDAVFSIIHRSCVQLLEHLAPGPGR
ncbi:MAG: low molecular weight phosphotyrosine protein phosphatase [Planctomycetes bacterium]|nr:low molecular weight phosphotyrosine protein phosphatase [Planctomycetota bacterium]